MTVPGLLGFGLTRLLLPEDLDVVQAHWLFAQYGSWPVGHVICGEATGTVSVVPPFIMYPMPFLLVFCACRLRFADVAPRRAALAEVAARAKVQKMMESFMLDWERCLFCFGCFCSLLCSIL